MCGSTELVKQDGFFVCQTCGTKYSVEEAKKMMIEGTVDVQGTVRVDNSDFVTKSLRNARRAKSKEDWEEAEKYYNLVEQNDPDSVEAIFYSAYAKAMISLIDANIYKREAAFKVLTNSVSVIDDHYDFQSDECFKIVMQISDDIITMASSSYLYNKTTTTNAYTTTTNDDKYRTITLFNTVNLTFTESLDHIIDGYSENGKAKKIALLKLAAKHTEFILTHGDIAHPKIWQEHATAYHNKIRALDPAYVVPEPIFKEDTTRYDKAKKYATSKLLAILCPCWFLILLDYRRTYGREFVDPVVFKQNLKISIFATVSWCLIPLFIPIIMANVL